ncbi:MAG TPA: FAD-dependent oxidoreductase, partial [Candidatus Obscuribacterales bacterium]
NVAYREFKRLTTEFRPLWKTLKGKNPTIPLTDEELLSLDKTPLSNYLKKYHPSFVALMDAFLKSASCAGSEGLSALAGSSILEDLIVPSYVLPGANPSFARALVQNLSQDKQQRMLGKAFVWSVTLSDSGATVVFGTRDGVLHRVRCRHVIMAVPALVAGRIMFNMKPADKAQFFTFRYGSYLVANFLLKKKVFSGSYDNFCAPPFSFADITIAETPYMRSGQYKPTMGSVLTVYQPYAPGSEGRSVLLEGNREKLARTLASQLVALFKDIEPAIGSVVLSRWGHAMAVTNPGYYARMSKIISAQTDSYSLAHSSFRGLPCIESAVEGARMAADRALKIKRTARARS